MARIRSNNVFGTSTDNPLTNVATTLNSAGLANLAVVAGADRAVITLDPNRVNGAPEIVYVSAHTGAATSATIIRGQEGTAARQHPSGTFWVHAITAWDMSLGQLGYAQATANQGGIITPVDATSLSAAVTVGAGRRVSVTASLAGTNDTANGGLGLLILEGAAQLQFRAASAPVGGYILGVYAQVVLSPSAGAHTYKVQAQRQNVGTLTLTASATAPNFILVEDIGSA